MLVAGSLTRVPSQQKDNPLKLYTYIKLFIYIFIYKVKAV